MTNKINPTILEQIIDKAKEKWKKETYFGGVTSSENIRTWVIVDVSEGVMRHVGISGYDGEKKYGDMNARRMAQLVDMVERHWEGGVRLTEYLVNQAIDEVLEDSRRKGKIKDEEESS